jgi:DnaJ-domain-containing protein 1
VKYLSTAVAVFLIVVAVAEYGDLADGDLILEAAALAAAFAMGLMLVADAAKRLREQQEQRHQQEARAQQARQQSRERERKREEKQRQQERTGERKAKINSDKPRDWWSVLGVAPDATLEVAKHAYRLKMKQYHPDRVSGLAPEFIQLAHEKSLELNRALDQARMSRKAKHERDDERS